METLKNGGNSSIDYIKVFIWVSIMVDKPWENVCIFSSVYYIDGVVQTDSKITAVSIQHLKTFLALAPSAGLLLTSHTVVHARTVLS